MEGVTGRWGACLHPWTLLSFILFPFLFSSSSYSSYSSSASSSSSSLCCSVSLWGLGGLSCLLSSWQSGAGPIEAHRPLAVTVIDLPLNPKILVCRFTHQDSGERIASCLVKDISAIKPENTTNRFEITSSVPFGRTQNTQMTLEVLRT